VVCEAVLLGRVVVEMHRCWDVHGLVGSTGLNEFSLNIVWLLLYLVCPMVSISACSSDRVPSPELQLRVSLLFVTILLMMLLAKLQ
jgi:hypothetical protein